MPIFEIRGKINAIGFIDRERERLQFDGCIVFLGRIALVFIFVARRKRNYSGCREMEYCCNGTVTWNIYIRPSIEYEFRIDFLKQRFIDRGGQRAILSTRLISTNYKI